MARGKEVAIMLNLKPDKTWVNQLFDDFLHPGIVFLLCLCREKRQKLSYLLFVTTD
jgi:hypothetical protein